MLVRERRAVKLVSVVDVYSWLVMFWLCFGCRPKASRCLVIRFESIVPSFHRPRTV